MYCTIIPGEPIEDHGHTLNYVINKDGELWYRNTSPIYKPSNHYKHEAAIHLQSFYLQFFPMKLHGRFHLENT